MLKLAWHTEQRTIKDLIPAEYNPRQMTEKQAKELRKSLDKFDLVEIPAVDVDGTILAGHQRLAMLGQMGRSGEAIDVRVPNRKLTDSEAKEYNLRSNKNTGEWDMDKLFAMPEELLHEVGFDNKEIQKLIDGHTDVQEDDFDVDEGLKQPPRGELGDIWQLGTHRLMCGDSTAKEDVNRLMDGKKADMVFTDPPYALFGNSTGLSGVTDDKMVRPFFKRVFEELRENVKYFAHVYVCCDWHSAFSLRDMYMEVGLKAKNMLIWDKGDGGIGSMYQHCYEIVWFLSNTPEQKKMTGRAVGERTVNGKSNILRFKRVSSSEREHNAAKPVDMISSLLVNGSDAGGIVFDLFGGSGSTLIACEQTKRVCYMMEIDLRYIGVIIDRFIRLTGKDAVRLSDGKKWSELCVQEPSL